MTRRTTLRYTGRIAASPYPGELAAAEPLSMLLLGEHDYLALREFENDSPHPVLVSYEQHYRLLQDLARRALEQLPGLRHVLVRFHTVYLRPLPAGLLDARTLLVDDPERLAEELLEESVDDILVIDDRIRRDTKERGDNRLVVTLHARAADRAGFAALLRGADFYRGTAEPDSAPAIAEGEPALH